MHEIWGINTAPRCWICAEELPREQPIVVSPYVGVTGSAQAHTGCYVREYMFDQFQAVPEDEQEARLAEHLAAKRQSAAEAAKQSLSL